MTKVQKDVLRKVLGALIEGCQKGVQLIESDGDAASSAAIVEHVSDIHVLAGVLLDYVRNTVEVSSMLEKLSKLDARPVSCGACGAVNAASLPRCYACGELMRTRIPSSSETGSSSSETGEASDG